MEHRNYGKMEFIFCIISDCRLLCSLISHKQLKSIIFLSLSLRTVCIVLSAEVDVKTSGTDQ